MTATSTLKAAIKCRLETELPELLSAQLLPDPSDVLTYWPGVPDPSRSPLVWVDIAGAARSRDPHRNTTHKYAEERTVLVGVSVAGEEAEAASLLLDGYVDLLRQCVEGDQSVDGNALWARWLTTDYSPNMAQTGLFREAVLTFDMPRQVTVPRVAL